MEKNYPVKYALLPHYEQKGFMVELGNIEPNYEITAYVVSKCFVVDEKTVRINDYPLKIYTVVFPYRTRSDLNREMNVPSEHHFYSTDVVHEVFDGYSEAKAECDQRNNMFTDMLLLQTELASDELELIALQQSEKLERLQEFEDSISEATKDLNLENGTYQKEKK
jgi:hypothetical protein